MATSQAVSKKVHVVNPEVFATIKKFGAFDVSACFTCGQCTVTCPLSVSGNEFPRKTIRYAVLGLEDKLLSHTEPWLCYYCGDCSTTCPSKAEPAEFMMATRRYLTAKYDWTGLSKKFYLSKKWEFGALFAIALLILGIFVIANANGISKMEKDRVSINSFAPIEWIHYGDIVLASVLAILLLSNAFRMYYYVILNDKSVKVPFKLYITEFKAALLFVFHAMTQWRWRSCHNRRRWIIHLFLVTGYATIFTLIMVFLDVFQRDSSQWHWSAILGYYSTVALLFVTLEAMWSRYKKSEEMHRFSHTSDWLFLIMLFLTALTGILLHLFRLMDAAYPSYFMYVIHLMIAGSMLIVEVPFGKWAHMLYRPLAIYLATVKQKALTLAGSSISSS
ncbi:MAG: 4Fe-4S dicluster domain-containing protein [Candidatus Hodarchaeales archaeon]|jgi:heterodisulfide reductase subunit C